jgi:hypothetical protein
MEIYYGSPLTTVIRTRPTSGRFGATTACTYTNAQVGVWFGQFMQPGWDMFQSAQMGSFHAAGRCSLGGRSMSRIRPTRTISGA